jgi:hypothetical protein
MIYNIRQGLQKGLCQKVSTGRKDWQFSLRQTQDVDLADPAAKRAGMTVMKIHRNAFKQKVLSQRLLGHFAKTADVVMGPICVLLGHSRPEGEWWRTDPDKILVNSYLHWYGSDNFFLQHPALVSLVGGLYRQIALLCRAGLAEEVINSVDYREVEECLSSNDWRLALAITKAARPWIEVPCAQHGYVANFPVPLENGWYWRRLQRLQRGARRHGYEKLLGQNFTEGWALEAKGTQWSGLYSFWGQKEEPTEAHRRLMELGRPLRRKKSGNKQAPRLT